jgi:hypothetical protein
MKFLSLLLPGFLLLPVAALSQAPVRTVVQQVDPVQKARVRELNKLQSALEIAERGRARTLAELLVSRSIDISTNTLKLPKSPNLAQIRQVANNQNATLVEYSLIGDTIYIWVIQPTLVWQRDG